MIDTEGFLMRGVFIYTVEKSINIHKDHTILDFFFFLFSVISAVVVSHRQLFPVPSASTLFASSPHTHTPGSYSPPPFFAAHLPPKYETCASWNIPPPRQPLASHHHKTTSTTFPRPQSSFSLLHLPLLSCNQDPPYRYLTASSSASSLLFLHVSHLPSLCIHKPSFMLLSASHVAGIILLWWIGHVCSNQCHLLHLLCFPGQKRSEVVLV